MPLWSVSGRYKPVSYTHLIDVTLIGESVDLFMETKRSQQDKPYYMPDKKHLLEYDDPFYCCLLYTSGKDHLHIFADRFIHDELILVLRRFHVVVRGERADELTALLLEMCIRDSRSSDG